jgi:thymidylate synthase
MASLIEIPDARAGYVDLVHHVYDNGKVTAPRGLETYEIEDATIVIDNPFDVLPIGTGRSVNTGIAAVEACQLLGGVSVPEVVTKVGPQFIHYREDNGMFHGAYGLRTRTQYDLIVNRLKADPDSRQAVVTLWNPVLDLQTAGKRDYPCTILHQFRIRNDKLNMSVYMRSNDVIKGCAYDFFQFTRVQIALASILNVGVGTYAHHVGSLHFYETDEQMLKRLHYPPETEVPRTLNITGSTWTDVANSANQALLAVLHDELLPGLNDDELWYTMAMRRSIERVKKDYEQRQ